MQHHQLTPQEWDALAGDPAFRALLARRRRFIIPATIFFIAFFLALPLALGLAPAAMSRPVLGPLTAAFALALSQFASSWLLLALYVEHARSFDLEAAHIVKHTRERLR